jgi:hypothetical protein
MKRLFEPEQDVVETEGPNEIVSLVQSAGLDPEAARSLEQAFSPLFTAAKKWQAQVAGITVTDPGQVREMKLARESRLALREIRVKAEKIRKDMKADSLRRGKAIDGVYNVLEYLIAPLEKHLLQQEQFVERMEAERKARIHAEREAALRPLVSDTTPYAFGDMSEDAFQDLYKGALKSHQEREALAKKAEEERIAREKAEAEERARIKAENDRLKAEAAKAEAERRATQQKLDQERAALAALAREKQKADELAAAKARAEKEAQARAARAPDREKLLMLAETVRKIEVPDASTPEGKGSMMEARDRIHALVKWIECEAEDF